jgi:TIR domain
VWQPNHSNALPPGPWWKNRGMTSGGLKTATAFWSYAHSDDDGSDGQIKRLKELVDHAFKRHSGEALKSFFDRHGDHRLEWGDEWREKISTTIWGTTFFIAVISPSYLKSTSCQDEFMQFWEKARDSGLEELLLPILWVKVYPETGIEQQIWEIAKEHQYVDWTSIRKTDEKSPEYKGLIDEMGERLADAARKVSKKPEAIREDAEGKPGTKGDGRAGGDGSPLTGTVERQELPGLVDIEAELVSHTESFRKHLEKAMEALKKIPQEVSVEPLHPGASAGQKLFFFKRLANEISPYAEEFERSAKQAEEAARLMNQAVFNFIDILADPAVANELDREKLDLNRFRQVPAELAARLGDYNRLRAQTSRLGRMSRDLRVPLSAMERGFDSLDAIMEMIQDWAVAFSKLGDDPLGDATVD